MRDRILKEIQKVKEERNIRVLFAIESGSRGWGFESPNSDYDVRLVYMNPREDYFNINEPKDNFVLPIVDELDINGWEIKKFMRMMAKSNATPLEWLQSPIIYEEEKGVREKLTQLMKEYFIPKATTHHYLGLASNSLKKGLSGDLIDIKKYFYVLRPLLAARWIVDRGTVPHMVFENLRSTLAGEDKLQAAIDELLIRKAKAMEGDFTTPIPIIQDFIHSEIDRCNELAKGFESCYHDYGKLNDYFKELLSY